MYSCVTPGCKKAAIFDTNVCVNCLENASKRVLKNFGTPEFVLCGHCEVLYNKEEFEKHMEDCLKEFYIDED